MDFLLIITYAAICIGIFKHFKIPVNAITLLTAVLGGVFLIGFLLLGMNYNHPYSSNGRFYYVTTPIVPPSAARSSRSRCARPPRSRRVTSLFRIDPTPYQAVVDQKKAALAEAEQAVKQLTAAREGAEARLKNAQADAQRTRVGLRARRKARARRTPHRRSVSHQEIDTKRASTSPPRANAAAAEAEVVRAKLAETSQIDGVNTTVAKLQADSRAPNTNSTRPRCAPHRRDGGADLPPRGVMAVAMPLRPVMVFRHDEKAYFGAAFLRTVPSASSPIRGRNRLPGGARRIIQRQGLARAGKPSPKCQLQPTGALIDPDTIKGSGRVVVRIEVDDEELSKYQIVPGTSGVVAVYTDHFRHLERHPKVLLRMNSWYELPLQRRPLISAPCPRSPAQCRGSGSLIRSIASPKCSSASSWRCPSPAPSAPPRRDARTCASCSSGRSAATSPVA